ncbi:MAG: bifunctional adenosylcobinamide kinase/adenosylcobinamide-phosphate guanylyltransferase, partial [Marmoricola sp.]
MLDEVVTVLAGRDDVVIVTNEVGLGVVPAHRSGRLFRDLLGTVNQRLAKECDEVHLVVAGRVLVL